MLDSKIFDFARRLIQTDIKKRQRPFFDELSRKGRELQLSGNSPETSSSGKKIIRNIFTKELETRASIVWKSLQRAHKAVGSKTTKTLASDFKEAVNHFLEEISKELSGLMMKKPCFAKNDKANSNLYSAMNDIYEEINVEIDLYVSNLQGDIMQKMNSGEKDYDNIVELLREDYLLKTEDDFKQEIATAAQNMISLGKSGTTVSVNSQLEPRLEHIKNLFDYLIDSLQNEFADIPLGEFRNKLLVIAQEEYEKLSSVPTTLLVQAGFTSQFLQVLIKQYEQKLKQEMSKTKKRIETQCAISESKIHKEKRNEINGIKAHKPLYKKTYAKIVALIFILAALTTLILNLNNIKEMIWGEAGKQTLKGASQENQQLIISKLDKLLKSTDNENKTKLLEKYPAGYVLFGVDLLSTFSSATFPHGRDLLAEYEFDWSKVKIEELTSTSLTILMPSILYKPLNTRLIGSYMKIPRRPRGKEYRYPVKPKGTLHRIFVELLEDNNKKLIFVIGFRKTAP